jgi:DNA-binding transcriptional MerR regulator
MRQLSIGEVARRTGVRTSALRYYEEAGILPAAREVWRAAREEHRAADIERISS